MHLADGFQRRETYGFCFIVFQDGQIGLGQIHLIRQFRQADLRFAIITSRFTMIPIIDAFLILNLRSAGCHLHSRVSHALSLRD